MSVYCLMVHSSATGARTCLPHKLLVPVAESPPVPFTASTRRLGVREVMGLTRKERRAIRYTQLQLSLLNRRKKRVAGGWVSLEVDKSVRVSIEAHMRRSR